MKKGLVGATLLGLLSLSSVQTSQAQTVENNVYTGQQPPNETGVKVDPGNAYRDPAGDDGVLGTVDDDLRPLAQGAFEGNTERVNLYGKQDTWRGAYSPNSSVLPVEIASYQATQVDDNTARLRWTAASEQNIAHYNVFQTTKYGERERIDKVQAKGTSNAAREYTTIDDNLDDNSFQASDSTTHPQTAYDVEAINLDGTIDNEFTIPLERRIADLEATMAPNPVSNHGTLTINNPRDQDLDITAYNVLGQRVYHETIDAQPGTQNEEIPVHGLASGKYFLRITGNSDRETIPFAVIK